MFSMSAAAAISKRAFATLVSRGSRRADTSAAGAFMQQCPRASYRAGYRDTRSARDLRTSREAALAGGLMSGSSLTSRPPKRLNSRCRPAAGTRRRVHRIGFAAMSGYWHEVNSGLHLRFWRPVGEQIQRLLAKFPTQWNREFISRNRECFGENTRQDRDPARAQRGLWRTHGKQDQCDATEGRGAEERRVPRLPPTARSSTCPTPPSRR